MRLFVALDVPDSVRNSLAALRERFQALYQHARWVPLAGMHVTLKFIGEVESARVDPIREALHAIAEPAGAPIELRFAGLSFFPNERSPRMLSAGIQAGASLAHLANGIEAALVPLDIPQERREFRPHLTLARFKPPARRPSHDDIAPLRQAVAAMAPAEFGRAFAGEFHLYRSVLKPAGAEYTRLETYPLIRERAC